MTKSSQPQWIWVSAAVMIILSVTTCYNNFAHLKLEIPRQFTLQCLVCGFIHYNGSPRTCSKCFSSREDLHNHVLDDHVKPMKKRGNSNSGMVPVCFWHGCESARIRKVFKLQHLKDHIVCHSKSMYSLLLIFQILIRILSPVKVRAMW